jgi:acyl dehydratase
MSTRAPSPFSLDFDSLEPRAVSESRARTVTEADVVAFSALTGDWHPQHSDAVWAAESDFGERIAHGMLVLSIAFGLVDFDPDRVVALRQVSRAKFKAPVRIGDTIRARVEIESARPLGEDRGLVTTSWRVLNQREEAVALLSVDLIWRHGGQALAGDGES